MNLPTMAGMIKSIELKQVGVDTEPPRLIIA
jgi:hypothetical protein